MDLQFCSRCQADTCVRMERVISGRRVYESYYCGRCGDGWQVQTPHAPEQRQVERRSRLDETVEHKKPARSPSQTKTHARKRAPGAADRK